MRYSVGDYPYSSPPSGPCSQPKTKKGSSTECISASDTSAITNACCFFFRFRCWWGYNLTSIYWIVEGPRLAVLLLNFIFLLNIIRVLVVKLRQSHTSDIEQVRKAVRAAIVLLPLLGITNMLNMTNAPLEKTAVEFALWSFSTHFLKSFQGLFVATIYCFLNNEVNARPSPLTCIHLKRLSFNRFEPHYWRVLAFTCHWEEIWIGYHGAIQCFPLRMVLQPTPNNNATKITGKSFCEWMSMELIY